MSFAALAEKVTAIANNEAALNASHVDSESRFPIEAIEALKACSAFSSGINTELGGLGLNVIEQSLLCNSLAKSCASSAMILGMHYIKCNSINEWASEQDFFADYLTLIVRDQRLIASMTSEEGIGGDLRQSNAAVVLDDSSFSITKKSPCLSYVSHADDILLTCRASEDSAHADQRLVLLTPDQMDIVITRTWDAMGMRGTCSHACEVSGKAKQEQIIAEPFSTIATQSMIPDAHIIWANIWLGIAQSAFAKAKKVSRKHFLKDADQVPGSARTLSNMHNQLLALEGQINTLANHYVMCKENKDQKGIKKSRFCLVGKLLKT